MRCKTKILLCLFCLQLVVVSGIAQNIQFTGVTANNLLNNPAFGININKNKLAVVSRNQWLGVSDGYNTYGALYNRKLKKHNAAYGVVALSDNTSTLGINTTYIGGTFVYGFKLSNKQSIAVGFKAVYVNLRSTPAKHLFADEIVFSKGISSVESSVNMLSTINYADVSFGAMYRFKELFWVGLVISHLNMPNVSLSGAKASLPISTTISGGVNAFTNGKYKVDAGFNYHKLLNRNQLDIGGEIEFKNYNFGAGLWYRGIPFLRQNKVAYTNDALSPMISYKLNKVELSYFYDVTVSKLQNKYSKGSHQLMAVYNWGKEKEKKKKIKKRSVPLHRF